MFLWKRRRRRPGNSATSVIDRGCEFSGQLTFVGTLVVNGKFQGQMLSSDLLLVAAKGEVEADVEVGTVIVSGQIKGNIVAAERVELRADARVVGDIASPVLVLEEGVAFDGRCRMKGEKTREAEGKGKGELLLMEEGKGFARLRGHG